MDEKGKIENVVTAEPSGVDGAVGVPEAKWFVAIVNSRHEKLVAEKLQTTGIETYVATQKEMRVWANGRRKIVDRPRCDSLDGFCEMRRTATSSNRQHAICQPLPCQSCN